jgi:peptide/nickel transport system permease protein
MTALTYSPATPTRVRRSRLRSIDWALVAGAAFFGALVLVAIYGPLIAPRDLYDTRSLFDGKAAPFPASREYPFGSDALGRDRLSWLLIGARGTVVTALSGAALRMVIGATLGLIAGFRGGLLSRVLRRVALGLSSVPATIATLLAVIATGVEPWQFVLAIGLIGWAEPFHQARRYARSESARPFMESARSLGLSERRLLFRHLLPNVAPQLLTTAAFQVSAVLLLTAELALLSIFIGGSVVVDFDSRGNAITAPRIPNWASMLATTRPIVSLYGDLASVLLPAGALLGAVLATNLFGDALAARAQRLDVYRLVSVRQVVLLAALGSLVVISVNAWPSRLSAEIEYAQGFDTSMVRGLAAELAALGSRPNGTPEADAAAALLAHRLEGTVVHGSDVTIRAKTTEVVIAGTRLPPEAVGAISLDDADVRGPLVYADTQSLFGARGVLDALAGAVVVLAQTPPAAFQRLADAHARAVIVVTASGSTFRRESGLYPLPAVYVTPSAFLTALGRPLPDLRAVIPRYQMLAEDVHLQITTERSDAPITDVITRVGTTLADAPIVILAARYDAAPGTGTTWDTATSAAMLVGVVEHLRMHPLPLQLLALATSADHQNYAGLRLGLDQLEPGERGRVQAIILLGPLLSDNVLLETQLDPSLPGRTGRLAARMEDALGAHLTPQIGGDLVRAIGSAKVSAPPLGISAPGADVAPGDDVLRRASLMTLVALAYIPRHLSEMR